MPVQAPVKLHLPNSLGGSLKLDDVTQGRLHLTLTLAREKRNPVSIKGMASQGAPFFAAGFKNPDGVWIFGVICQ